MLRKCISCGVDKPHTSEFFGVNRAFAAGLNNRCRPCGKSRAKHANARWYAGNRARALANAYLQWDRRAGLHNELGKAALQAYLAGYILGKPCAYCGISDDSIGADRIDNGVGHLPHNLIPACGVCNVVRNNIFTCEEMKEIGKAIGEIRRRRPGIRRI